MPSVAPAPAGARQGKSGSSARLFAGLRQVRSLPAELGALVGALHKYRPHRETVATPAGMTNAHGPLVGTDWGHANPPAKVV